MMVMVVVVTTAVAVFIVVMMMVVLVVVASAVAVFIVMMVVVMLVVVASAVAIFIVTVVMVMLVVVASAVAVFIVMVVMVMMVMCQLLKLGVEGGLLLHSLKDGLAVEVVPRGRNQGSGLVMLANKFHRSFQLFSGDAVGMAENDRVSVLDLIVEELAEVLHIHLALISIDNGGETIKQNVGAVDILDRADNVAEFSDTRGLDKDAVGRIFVKHLFKSLSEVTDQTATDATRVHLGNRDACVLQKAAVNTDFAKLVFDKHQLLARVGFLDQFFDKSGLARSQKTRKNINFGHTYSFSPDLKLYPFYYNTHSPSMQDGTGQLFFKRQKNLSFAID